MFGHEWKVIIDKNKAGGSYSWGDFTIILGDKYGEKESILMHEIMEAVLTDLCYRFYGQEGAMEYIFHFDHTGLTRFHKAVFEILKDNKLI